MKETGRFETTHASKYLQQLCKHFSHKTEVTFDASSGVVALSQGPATLAADDAALTVEIAASDVEGLAKARHVIDAHLARFAFREEFNGFEWKAVEAA